MKIMFGRRTNNCPTRTVGVYQMGKKIRSTQFQRYADNGFIIKSSKSFKEKHMKAT